MSSNLTPLYVTDSIPALEKMSIEPVDGLGFSM